MKQDNSKTFHSMPRGPQVLMIGFSYFDISLENPWWVQRNARGNP